MRHGHLEFGSIRSSCPSRIGRISSPSGREAPTYIEAERVADKIGLRKLFIKDETTNPTGSFIDRGVTVEVSKAKELGYRSTACGTTGNLGASLAAYSAKAGFKCKIFLPKRIDLGKFYQIIAYGAEVEACKRL